MSLSRDAGLRTSRIIADPAGLFKRAQFSPARAALRQGDKLSLVVFADQVDLTLAAKRDVRRTRFIRPTDVTVTEAARRMLLYLRILASTSTSSAASGSESIRTIHREKSGGSSIRGRTRPRFPR